MRVVSLVPAATELLCAAGGESLLVGRSHECDWPPSVSDRPVLTTQRTTADTPAEIDAQVTEAIDSGASLYLLDTEQLRALQPDVILTQDLCHVCSIDLDSVRAVAAGMDTPPAIVSLNPSRIEDVFDDLVRVGNACGIEDSTREALAALRERWWNARDFVNQYLDGPQLAVLEWTDPLYVAGHWTPDIVLAAGARHDLNAPGATSRPIAPEDLLEVLPERLVICPCGRTLEQARQDIEPLKSTKWWSLLPAVQDGQVMVVDGQAMFSRPGPRLVDALEWLTGWIQDRPALLPQGFPAIPLD
ncbi:MAG: ABC transporter substrate-binding protein [Phycisphaerales bacterium]|nr:ABC transporter substrate-binding protein [Phycisphaerales bacterium]